VRAVGITGGIASGKSAVEALLSAFPVIDADRVSREVVAPGQPGLQAIVDAFGDGVLQEDGQLDRSKLRHWIARDAEAQKRLNSILHPIIGEAIEAKLAELAKEPVVFVSAALMLETGSYRRYDDVILVTAPESIRLERLMARDGMSQATARQLMAKQWSDSRKREFATVEIVNDSDFATLAARTRAALAELGIPWREV